MRKVIISKFPAVRTTSVLALLLILIISGCGREQAPVTSPVVVSVSPCERRHRRSGSIVDHRYIQQSDESHIDQYFDVYRCADQRARR